MDRKYELTNETKKMFGRTLYRIRALKSFDHVTAGELGGWIEKEENLSQEGLCWVFDNARVYDNAQVFGDAEVYDYAWVFGDAWVYDNARVSGDAEVYGNAKISGNMVVQKIRDYLTFGPAGERNDIMTFGRTDEGVAVARCGCFYGTLDEFAEAVEKKHGNNVCGKEYRAAIEAAKVRFCEEEAA